MRKKYLNGHRRELILWIHSLEGVMGGHMEFLEDREERRWLNSILLSITGLSKAMFRGLHETEIRALLNASKQVRPSLYAEIKTPPSERETTVSQELLFYLAESAVELCKYDCDKDWDNCPRRKMFLELLLEPWSLSGPCQYYRGEKYLVPKKPVK